MGRSPNYGRNSNILISRKIVRYQILLPVPKSWSQKIQMPQLVRTKSFFVKHANFITHDASFEVMILLLYYWLHVKRVNCYVYYDLFCYTGRFVYFGTIFMLKMKQKLRLRTTTGSLPTACKQRMILDICYGL